MTSHRRGCGQTAATPRRRAGGPDGPSIARIDTCVHCGFCLPTCPTYLLWGEEMDSPRGRIYLMKAGVEGRAELTPSFVQHFDNCLGCLACVTACPSGVQYGPLIEQTRAQIEQTLSAAGRPIAGSGALLMAVVPYPGAHALGAAAAGARRAGCCAALARATRRAGAAAAGSWRRLVALVGAGAAGHAGGAVRHDVPEVTPAAGQRAAHEVALLTGCVQRLAFGHVNDATVRVLAAEGCEVQAPASAGLLRRAAAARRAHRAGARAGAAQHRGVRAGRASTASW